MAVFVALLRAINVGGTGKLAMTDLVKLCAACGFEDAKTYIQSGNVVFRSALAEPKAKAKLEKALAAKLGKPVGVILRSRAELDQIIDRNPFKVAPPNRVLVLLLDEKPPKGALAEMKAPAGEEFALEGRELYLHYPDGMGQSKLKVPLAKLGTGRNVNTVVKLAAMAKALEDA